MSSSEQRGVGPTQGAPGIPMTSTSTYPQIPQAMPPASQAYPAGPSAYPPVFPPQDQFQAPAGPSSYGVYNIPPGAAGSSGQAMPPPQRPYDMPSRKPNTPWAGGGPVGTGVVPVDVEAQVLAQFADKVVRRGFVRKVFGIVAVQLLITVGFSLVCLLVNPVKNYVQSTPWPFYLSWGLSFGLMLVIACNERLRRKWPVNMIFLAAFTVCEAFLVGMITAYFDVQAVVIAFIATTVAVVVLALIACQPWIDITSWGTFLIIPLALLVTLILIGIFWANKIFYLVIAGGAALLTSVYLVYDLQLIMGGKQYAISPDEYIFAALSLYLDIVQLFLWILYIVGLAGGGSSN